jgi:hypothetical protein
MLLASSKYEIDKFSVKYDLLSISKSFLHKIVDNRFKDAQPSEEKLASILAYHYYYQYTQAKKVTIYNQSN